ncbi:MAG: DUF3105 domain-containing protein [bacterium]|nr:DUF3105 domain-containing protein [bacterium]
MDSDKKPYQFKKDAREAKKDIERRAQQGQRFKSRSKGYLAIFIIIIIVVYGVYLIVRAFAPKGEDFSQAFSIIGDDHIAAGSQLPEYNSNPPTSGSHYGQTARSGFRDEEISDQNIIHNLEHGDIWIAYHPSIDDEIKEELKQFAAAKVIITPREANETAIAIAAWGRLDTFNIENDTLPIERITDFIRRYTNQGPERVTGASRGI